MVVPKFKHLGIISLLLKTQNNKAQGAGTRAQDVGNKNRYRHANNWVQYLLKFSSTTHEGASRHANGWTVLGV